MSINPVTGGSRSAGAVKPRPHQDGIYAISTIDGELWLLSARRQDKDGELRRYTIPGARLTTQIAVKGLGRVMDRDYMYATDMLPFR